MLKRFLPYSCLLILGMLLLPQSAQTFTQDESIKEAVKPHIEAGVEFLRRVQTNSGAFPFQGSISSQEVVGATALGAIALMECGASTRDRQVLAAANFVRNSINNTPNYNYNYGTCLALMMLDRLNRDSGTNHKDVGMIKALATRIARGQGANGGWDYTLPGGRSDNSNTQFAVVALWIARKYYKPGGDIDRALALTDRKFRSSQSPDGGWSYDPTGVQVQFGTSGSMTCAGILGIALHAGARKQLQESGFRGAGTSGSSGDVFKQLNEDPQVAKARAYLVRALEAHITGRVAENTEATHPTYFFWSLERAATLYKWRKMDGVDWFEIGARFLMSKQARDGSWNMGNTQGPVVDTSFCLLFLAKSNLLGSLQESGLTGGSLGDTPNLSREKKVEPKPQNDQQKAKELLEKLLTALPPQQGEILDALSEARGTDYTDALVDAISKLGTNAAKEQAREALAKRFTRLKASVLGQYMREDERELRLAAATACQLKNDSAAAASLIPLLADPDIGVSTAALNALKTLSGQDFGKSVERWSRWLDTVNSKKP